MVKTEKQTYASVANNNGGFDVIETCHLEDGSTETSTVCTCAEEINASLIGWLLSECDSASRECVKATGAHVQWIEVSCKPDSQYVATQP